MCDARALSAGEVEATAERLAARWLSMRYCQAGDPVKAEVTPVIWQVFSLWRPDAQERLRRVLDATGSSELFVLAYEVDGEGRIHFGEGHAIDRNMPAEGFRDLGQEIGFAVNGLEFHLCDASLQWTIGTTVDAEFMTGEEPAVTAYAGSPDERAQAVAAFIAFVDRDEILPAFRRMKDYVR